jgi:hypothetical protein
MNATTMTPDPGWNGNECVAAMKAAAKVARSLIGPVWCALHRTFRQT